MVVAPVVGGLLYGPLVRGSRREARGHGVPEVMLAVNRMGGRIRPRVPVVKSLASAICIGSGGSVGREGPIVQIGSALGSVPLASCARAGVALRMLVACGAAGGDLGDVQRADRRRVLRPRLILRNFAGPLVWGGGSASFVADRSVGRRSATSVSAPVRVRFLRSPLELLALHGARARGDRRRRRVHPRAVYGAEDLADRLWQARPEWLRPAAGGVCCWGCCCWRVPALYGVGYPVLERAVGGHYVDLVLLGLLAAKIVATSLTIAIGGSGGVFAPSLFIGAMLGSAYGAGAPSASAPDRCPRVPTGSSGWARSSRQRRARRSPR